MSAEEVAAAPTSDAPPKKRGSMVDVTGSVFKNLRKLNKKTSVKDMANISPVLLEIIDDDDDPDRVLELISNMQVAIRRFLSLIKRQRVEVQERVKERHRARAKLLINDHFIDEPNFDFLTKLPELTVDSANSLFNCFASHKKPALTKVLIEHAQTLTRVIRGVGLLVEQATTQALAMELQVFLCDIFNSSFASFFKLDATAVQLGDAMQVELGDGLHVPIASLAFVGKAIQFGRAVSSTPSNAEQSELCVVSWQEPGLRKPEVVVSSRKEGDMLLRELQLNMRNAARMRPTEPNECQQVLCVPVGAPGPVTAVVMLARSSSGALPFKESDCALMEMVAFHLRSAIRNVECREALAEEKAVQGRLTDAAAAIPNGLHALEAQAKNLIDADDCMVLIVEDTDSAGRPVLSSSSSRKLPDDMDMLQAKIERSGIISVRQGSEGALQRCLASAPPPTRYHSKTMLCVGITVNQGSVSPLEVGGMHGMILWRNRARGPFNDLDLRIASQFSSMASSALQLVRTEEMRVELRERNEGNAQKRDLLMSSAKMMATMQEIGPLFLAIMSDAKVLMEVDRSTLFLVDKRNKMLWTMVADGASAISVPCDQGLAGAAYTGKMVINVRDAYQDSRFDQSFDQKTGYRTSSVLCYPILGRSGPASSEEVIGVIQLINKGGGSGGPPIKFTEQDEDLIAAFGAQIGMCIQHATNYQLLHREHTKLKATFKLLTRLTAELPLLAQHSKLSDLYMAVQKLCGTLTDSRTAVAYSMDRSNPEKPKVRPALTQEEAPRLLPPTPGMRRIAQELVEADKGTGETPVPVHSVDAEMGEAVCTIKLIVPPVSLATIKELTARADPGQRVQDAAKHAMLRPGTCLGALQIAGKRPPEVETDQVKVMRRKSVALAAPLVIPESAPKKPGEAEDTTKKFSDDDERVLQLIASVLTQLAPVVERRQKSDAQRRQIKEVNSRLRSMQDFLLDISDARKIKNEESLFQCCEEAAGVLCVASSCLFLIGTSNKGDAGYHEPGDKPEGSNQELYTLRHTELPKAAKRGKAAGEGKPSGAGAPSAAAVEKAAGGGKAGAGGKEKEKGLGEELAGARVKRLVVPLGMGLLGHAAVGGQTLVVEEALIDQRFEPLVDELASPLPEGGTVACVPLHDRGGSVIGVLQVMGGTSDDLLIRDDTLELMKLLGHVLAVNVLHLRADGRTAAETAGTQRALQEMQHEAGALFQKMLQHRRDTYAPPADAGREVETAEVAVQTAPLQLPGRGGRGSVSCIYTDDLSAGGVYTGPLLGAQAEDAGRRGSATGIDSAMRPPELSLDERVLTLDVGSKSSGRIQSLAPSAVSSGGKSAERRRQEAPGSDPVPAMASSRLRGSASLPDLGGVRLAPLTPSPQKGAGLAPMTPAAVGSGGASGTPQSRFVCKPMPSTSANKAGGGAAGGSAGRGETPEGGGSRRASLDVREALAFGHDPHANPRAQRGALHPVLDRSASFQDCKVTTSSSPTIVHGSPGQRMRPKHSKSEDSPKAPPSPLRKNELLAAALEGTPEQAVSMLSPVLACGDSPEELVAAQTMRASPPDSPTQPSCLSPQRTSRALLHEPKHVNPMARQQTKPSLGLDEGAGPFSGRKKRATIASGAMPTATAAKAGVDASAATQANPVHAGHGKKEDAGKKEEDPGNPTELWEDLERTVRDL